MERDFEKLYRQDRQEYMDRLEAMHKENIKCTIVRTICVTAIIIVWIICYMFTPYLTKNYVKGDNNKFLEGGSINVGDN